MSTIDPAEVRRARAERGRGSLGAALLAVLGALLVVVTGAIAGYAVAVFLDQFRIMELNSVFSSWDSDLDPMTLAWVAPLGVFASIFAWSLYADASRRYLGRPGFSVVGPLTLWLVGAALGVWCGCANWTDPDAVGIAVDPAFGDDETWGFGAWTFYWAQLWLPALVALLALASLVIGIAARAGKRGRDATVAELLASGRRAEGVVTATVGPSTEAGRVAGEWTVKFTDLHGQDRWVARLGAFPAASPPAVGERVTVLYDPASPGAVKRIFLARGTGTTIDDFTQHEL